MRILAATAFPGPSVHGRTPLVHWRVDFQAGDGPLPAAVPEAVLDAFPALRGHAALPAADVPAPAALARLAGLAAVALQNEAGAAIAPDTVRETAAPDATEFVHGHEEADTGLAAGRLALALLRHHLAAAGGEQAPPFDLGQALEAFRRNARRRLPGLEHRHVAQAATARDIPWEHLGDGLVLFGQGRFQRRRLGHFNDRTSHLGWLLTSDKSRTNRVLAALGLPVPRQHLVASAARAVRAAERIGYPVVVKPADSDYGNGVGTDLKDAAAVEAAFDAARRFSPAVIVESFIRGLDYRLTVVDGRVAAAARRIPAGVVGDGRRSVAQLVAAVNARERRGDKGASWRVSLALDDEARRLLAAAGHGPDTVPAEGEALSLRSAANMAMGGSSIDVTDQVHPDNARLAVWAAAAFGLDVAGVDFIGPDIARSYLEAGGGICEVNTSPGLTPHVDNDGPIREIAAPIMASLFPAGADARVPVAVLVGGAEAVAAARALALLLAARGHVVGLATDAGVEVGGATLVGRAVPGPAAARMLLRNPMLDAAVLQATPESLLRQGLGVADCDAAAVLGLPAAADERLLAAAALPLEVARRAVVVDGDDRRCRPLADRASAASVYLATTRPVAGQAASRLVASLERGAGGLAVTLRRAGAAPEVVALGETDEAAARPLLFAVALAHGLGHAAAALEAALRHARSA